MCLFFALMRQIPASGACEVRNSYGFDGGNRIGKGRKPKLNLTCAFEFPMLQFTILKYTNKP